MNEATKKLIKERDSNDGIIADLISKNHALTIKMCEIEGHCPYCRNWHYPHCGND